MEQYYQNYRNLLFKLAYQLTGSVADAEDAVQDVFMKVYERNAEPLAHPKAYLCKMVTNRCLDQLKSARSRREQYIGPWLPEPIATEEDDPYLSVERGEQLSYAMLALLERLSPAERAVFVLREALAFDYPEIAELVDKSEANCRKLLSRARAKMELADEAAIAPEPADETWIRRFLSALEQGSPEKLLPLLAEDAVLLSDGGGKVSAAVHPIVSGDRVARFLLGIAGKWGAGASFHTRPLNGQPCIVIRAVDGLDTVIILHVEGETISRLYMMRNPDKLGAIAGHR